MTDPTPSPQDLIDRARQIGSVVPSPEDAAKMSDDLAQIAANRTGFAPGPVIAQKVADTSPAAPTGQNTSGTASTAAPEAFTPQPDDNIKQQFLASRAAAQRSAINDKFEQLLQPQPKAAQPGVPAEPTAPQPTPQGPIDESLTVGQKILNGVTATARDVAEGALDAPRQIAGGALDWWNNLQTFAEDVSTAAQKAGVPDLVISFTDDQGNWSPHILSPDEALKQREAGTLGASLTVPTTGKPDTITGSIIRFGATFAMGRGSAGGPLASIVKGIPGEVLRDFVSGATGQDETTQRLSNLIEGVAPNQVTEALEAKPEDRGTLVGHLKSGLEYAGLGALTSAGQKVVKALRGNAKPEATPQATGGAEEITALGGQGSGGNLTGQLRLPSKSLVPGATKTGEQIIGTNPENAIQISPNIESDAERFLMGESGENPVKINLDAIDSPDKLKQAVAQLSTFIKKQGPQSHDETRSLALSLGMTPADLANGYRGQLPTAAEMDAMNLIVQSGAEQVGRAAKVFFDPEATAEQKYTALQTVAKQLIIQQQFEGAKSEVARSLNVLQSRVGPHADYADALNRILVEGNGDIESTMAQVVNLGNPEIGGDPQKVSEFLGRSLNSTTRDLALKVYYNVLLSNPRTIIKKLTSDSGMVMWNMATRFAAENGPGMSGEVQPGEAGALAYGYIRSFMDAVRAAGKALSAGQSQFYRQYQTMDAFSPAGLSRLSSGSPPTLTSQAPTQSAMALLKSIAANGWRPTSWIGSADDFAKVWNYRAELYSLAFRESMKDGGDSAAAWDAAEKALGDIGTAQIPQAMHEQALAGALRNTFQEPLTGIGAKIQDIADDLNLPIPHTNFKLPLGRIIMPFVKVPYNIAKWSVVNSPLGLLNQNIKNELNAGGAVADLAKARIALGSAAAMAFADIALNGVVTGAGPRDPQLQRAWRAAGNEPYSLQLGRLGGIFANMPPIGYNQVEPFGMMLGAIADTFDIMRFAKEDGRQNLAASLALGIGNATLSKTYFQSLSNFFTAMNNPERDGSTWANSILTSMAVPRGVAGLATAFDPWQRAHYGLIDDVTKQIPFLSKNLPPQRTLWGDPIPLRDGFLPFMSGTGAARMLSPVPLGRDLAVQPIDKWIYDNRMEFPRGASNQLGISPPGQVQSFTVSPNVSVQIQLEPEELDRFKVLAGNGLKDPRTGLGARDFLNSLVEGKNPDTSTQDEWNDSSAAEKALMVQRVVNRFRAGARKQLPLEFPALASAIAAGAQLRAQQLQPAQ